MLRLQEVLVPILSTEHLGNLSVWSSPPLKWVAKPASISEDKCGYVCRWLGYIWDPGDKAWLQRVLGGYFAGRALVW